LAGRTTPWRSPPVGAGRLSWVVAAAAVAVLAAFGGWFLWNRIAQVQQGAVLPAVPPGVTRDPATRARGAVLSISGQDSRPHTAYDPASGTVTAQFQSKYYDPKHSPALNRQYLATEGRLVVQLVFYDVPEIARVVAQLYSGGRLLATVTGTPDQTYAGYTVEYAPGLP
jgi:hypothetical protein